MKFIPLLLMPVLIGVAGSAQAMNLGLRVALLNTPARHSGGGSEVTSWESVTDSTAFSSIPGLSSTDAAMLANAGVKATALAAWAKGVGGVTIGSTTINLSAFLMNARNDETSFAIDEELLSAVLAGDANAQIFKTRFPNAKVEIIEVNEGALKSGENAKFYRLKLNLPTEN